MLIVPTVTGIRTFIGRPSVPHFSISPATCQGQAADAVAALAHARNLRPLALEILCVPRFAHLQKILNTAAALRKAAPHKMREAWNAAVFLAALPMRALLLFCAQGADFFAQGA